MRRIMFDTYTHNIIRTYLKYLTLTHSDWYTLKRTYARKYNKLKRYSISD